VYAAISLLTIRDHIPDAKLYIISAGLSKYDKKLLNKYNIGYKIIDLSNLYTKIWDYPIECYYLFSGPEYFKELGYEYSVYIDGDVLCKNNPLLNISGDFDIAGVVSAPQKGQYISIFGNDWSTIKKIWKLPDSLKFNKRINSGVVYFNNSKMKKFKLQDKASEVYKTCLTNNIPRKGDDSLFSLLQYIYFESLSIKYLKPEFNFVLQFNEWKYPVKGLIFFHFSIDKPWKKRPYTHNDVNLNIYNPYVILWRAKFRKVAFTRWTKSNI
jgi:hypothetical protein